MQRKGLNMYDLNINIKEVVDKLVGVCYVYYYKEGNSIEEFKEHLEDSGLSIEEIEEIIIDTITYEELKHLFVEMKGV